MILGGYYDGTIVPVTGPYMRMPVPLFTPVMLNTEVPPTSSYKIEEFRLVQDFDCQYHYVKIV